MAEKLLQYYKYMADVGGVQAKMQLAVETKLSSVGAATAPDSPENIDRFRKAIEKITKKPAPIF